MPISDKRLFSREYPLIQWRDADSLLNVSITVVPPPNVRLAPFPVQENVTHGDYIQYLNLIAIPEPHQQIRKTLPGIIPTLARKIADLPHAAPSWGHGVVAHALITKTLLAHL